MGEYLYKFTFWQIQLQRHFLSYITNMFQTLLYNECFLDKMGIVLYIQDNYW